LLCGTPGGSALAAASAVQRITDPTGGRVGKDTSVPTNDAARMAKAMLDKVKV
jgi:hypothetical protein